MSTNEFLSQADDIVSKQGWSEATLLELALEFIGDSPATSKAFLAFLKAQAAMENEDDADDSPDESMDGDAGSALASAGFGTDEDYGSNYNEDFFESSDLD